jgi:hypothetical protein
LRLKLDDPADIDFTLLENLSGVKSDVQINVAVAESIADGAFA